MIRSKSQKENLGYSKIAYGGRFDVHDVSTLNPFTIASFRARTHLIDIRYFGDSRMFRDTLRSLTNEEE